MSLCVSVNQKAAVLEGSDTLSPDAVQLFTSLTSLQPKIFAQLRVSKTPSQVPDHHSAGDSMGTVRCRLVGNTPAPQGIQLQPVLCPSEGHPAQSPSAPPCSGSDLLGPSSPTQFLQSSASLAEGISLVDTSALLGVGQLVSVSVVGEGGGDVGVQQILLSDAPTIPVRIVEPVIVGEPECIPARHGGTGS